MKDYIANNWLFITILIVGIIFLLLYKLNEKKKDSVTDYDRVNLKGEINVINGEPYFYFKYDSFSNQNKLRYILNNYKQNTPVESEYGDRYVISHLISKRYFFESFNNNGERVSKDGPYILYKLVPEVELKQVNNNFNNLGPVQIVDNNSTATMNIIESQFNSKVSNYFYEMVEAGIPEKDINILMQNSNDSDVKQSFFSKYGIELAKIAVDLSGTIISLLTYLKQ